MILILLLRRRAPFVVPAATWLVSAALSYVDGSLIVGQAPVSIAGMIAAVLLGNLRDERQARVGLAVVVVCATAVVYNDPTRTVGNLFFVPVLFAVGWPASRGSSTTSWPTPSASWFSRWGRCGIGCRPSRPRNERR